MKQQARYVAACGGGGGGTPNFAALTGLSCCTPSHKSYALHKAKALRQPSKHHPHPALFQDCTSRHHKRPATMQQRCKLFELHHQHKLQGCLQTQRVGWPPSLPDCTPGGIRGGLTTTPRAPKQQTPQGCLQLTGWLAALPSYLPHWWPSGGLTTPTATLRGRCSAQ